MKLKIEKNVPAPVREPETRGRGTIYPFADMEIGDSFPVPKEKVPSTRWSASRYQKYHPGHFFTVQTDDKGNTRCWRVAVPLMPKDTLGKLTSAHGMLEEAYQLIAAGRTAEAKAFDDLHEADLKGDAGRALRNREQSIADAAIKVSDARTFLAELL